jgi:hypothetical protein
MSEPKPKYREGVNSKRGMTPLECILLLDQYLPGRDFTLSPGVFDALHADLQTARHADSMWRASTRDGRATLFMVSGDRDIRVTRGEEP